MERAHHTLNPHSFEWPPQGLFMDNPSPNVFVARRPTKEELAALPSRYPDYCRWCEQQAELKAGDGNGPTREAWESEPDTYRGECFKGCYSVQTLYKGSVYEFGAYGVYVCCGCGYAYPPNCEPAPVE